jgi:hypothetical protein
MCNSLVRKRRHELFKKLFVDASAKVDNTKTVDMSSRCPLTISSEENR